MTLKLACFLLMILIGRFTLHAQAVTAFSSATYIEPASSAKVIQLYTGNKSCADNNALLVILDEAIIAGAPTYNSGNHLGCFRIYEGAAYKVLYKYGSKCKDVKGILEAALEKAYGDYTSTEKAWIMRTAFDYILGVPTQTTK